MLPTMYPEVLGTLMTLPVALGTLLDPGNPPRMRKSAVDFARPEISAPRPEIVLKLA